METIQKEKVKLTAKVVSQEALTDDICSMWIQADEIAKAAKPGQFISVYTKDKSKVLPRPISLCEIDKEQGRLRIVYRVVGAGTKEFSAYQAGDDIEIMGPLGNGFPLKEKKAFLIGGGIGIPPMLELAKNLKGHLMLITGDVDKNVPPSSTYRLADALIKANKRFDMFILPGKDHGVMCPYYQNLTRYSFVENLIQPVKQHIDIINHN